MIDLPDGWTSAPLSVVADLVRGVTYKKTDASATSAKGYVPIIRATNINGQLALDSEMVYVPARCVRPEQRLEVGDIIVATSSGSANVVGKSARLKEPWEGAFGAFCMVIRPSRELAPGYIAHLAASPEVRKRWRELAQGTNINNLKSSDLANTVVALPPAEEQSRIVAAIEEQFSRLDAGVGLLKRVQQNIERVRAASFLRFHDQALLASTPKTMTEVCEFIIDGDHNPPRRVNNGIPYLTARHVKRGRVSTEGATFISEEDFAFSRRRYDPRCGDVLVTCVGTLGEVAVVPDGLVFAADRNLAAIRPSADVLPSFLEAILRSPRLQKVLTAGSGSTAQPHLYLKDLRQLQVPVPPLEVQESLIASLREQLAFVDRLDKDVMLVLARSQTLRASVLVAAFSGKLVPRDPAEEHASVLVERITVARSTSNGHKPARTRKGRVPEEKVTV